MLHSSSRIISLCVALIAIGLLIGYFWGVHNGKKAFLFSSPVDYLAEIAPFSPGASTSGDPISEGSILFGENENIIISTKVSLSGNSLILEEDTNLCRGACLTLTLTPALLQGVPLSAFDFSLWEETLLTLEDGSLQNLAPYSTAEVYVSDIFAPESSIESIVFF